MRVYGQPVPWFYRYLVVMTELSIVVPVFNEVDAVEGFVSRIRTVLEAEVSSYEILFVDDGSVDGTAAAVLEQRKLDSRVKLIRLSRNFGKEVAMTAGLDMAEGAAAIPMDVDLQDPPELIPEMIAKWRGGADVVIARRVGKRDDGLAKNITARGYYRLMRMVSGTAIPEHVGDFRLLDRVALDALSLFPERTRFMKGVFALLGFEQAEVTYERPKRAIGAPSQSWRRLMSLALEGVVSFSVAPLRVWTVIGFLSALAAVLYGVFIVVDALVYGRDTPGYASLITVVLLMNGLILIGMGMIGEYVSRIFVEVKKRPLYLVRERHGVEATPRAIRETPNTSTAKS